LNYGAWFIKNKKTNFILKIKRNMGHGNGHKLSIWGIIVTLGIVYGDIGTSPLYVMRAIVGDNTIDQPLIYGGLSCIFWTLTIQASIKYILLALSADNRGEGGIFALYGLIRRVSPKWMIYVAMAGCSALLADGIITPAISLTSAVEGLKKVHDIPVVPIVIAILFVLFAFQQFGTEAIGKFFGPITLVWFMMLIWLGMTWLVQMPQVVVALNPYYAVSLIVNNPKVGMVLIGAVFLCVTGAEALYSDLGHCGKENIRWSWIFVKISLIINYLGQGAYLLLPEHHLVGAKLGAVNPFYDLMPTWFIYPGIIISAMATVIASQALITGSFSLINEAVKLKVWYRLKIQYPTEQQQQLYIPTINWMLFFGCLAIVLYFQESSNMEHAYGLAITIAMLSTTCLMLFYFSRIKRKSMALVVLMGIIFFSVELCFTYSNVLKLFHGAWVTLVLTMLFFTVMYVHYRASRIRSKAMKYLKWDQYTPILKDVISDETIPKFATNLVYMINANRKDEIESSVINSLFYKQAKRAETYWFINIHVTDEPYTQSFKTHCILPKQAIRVDFYLGYRVHPSINILFKQVVDELQKTGEFEYHNSNITLDKYKIPADFKYITIEKVFAFEDSLSTIDKMTVRLYKWLNTFSSTAGEHFELLAEDLLVEKYPIRIRNHEKSNLTRLTQAPHQ
jgi:KUP system potassium uptake protein